jgi:hypothetical protein
MSFLVSPYTQVTAHEKALQLREKAGWIELGVSGGCAHPSEKVHVDEKINTNADNDLGPESTVTVTCTQCDSKATRVFQAPVCYRCSDFTTEKKIVPMVTTGPLPQRHSRDYNRTYPCVCPKCGSRKPVELISGYS